MSLRNSFDVRHPMFRPLWRRGVFCALILGWAVYEAISGNSVWALVFAGAGAYLVYEFFVVFDPKNYEPKADE